MLRQQLIGLALSVVSVCVLPAGAFETPQMMLAPSITVNGQGKAYAHPDLVEINVGVVSQAKTAADALNRNNADMTKLMDTLKTSGVSDDDISTSSFNVNPVYNNENNPNPPLVPQIVAYRVENTAQVRVRKIKSLGSVLDAIVRAGANNVNGIDFSLAKPAAIYDAARTDAMADARRKAELYALAAGVKLGRVLYVSENAGSRPVPMMAMTKMAGGAADSSVSVATGNQEFSANVEVVYAIQP